MSKRSGKFYYRNENEVMTSLGLEQTKGSGNGWIEKEDGQNEFILAQLKSTDADSIRINKLDVDKLEYNAMVSKKVPIFAIQFLKTGEIFLMAKPMDIPDVAKYIETGECKIPITFIESEDIVLDKQWEEQEQKIKSSKKSREKFYKEREKQWKHK